MIGIIILNYNSWKEVFKCVDSIRSSTICLYKIYIVDNASVDDSWLQLRRSYTEVKDVILIETGCNMGYANGNNVGIKKAMEDGMTEILICNTDVCFLQHSIDFMYNSLNQDVNIAVVGPRIYNIYNEDMQFASKLLTFRRFLRTRKPFCYLDKLGLSSDRYYKYDVHKPFAFKGMVSGCCFLIRVDDFKQIDFFDSHTFLFYEEDIIAYKLNSYNKLTLINSDAIVIHNHSTSIKKEGAAFIRFHRNLSALYTLKVYGKINKIQLSICITLVILPFCFISLYNKSYRILVKKLLKRAYLLYFE